MHEPAPLSGVLAPVVTPFKADLSVDADRLVGHCRWLLSQNCGLAVFGTNSEANSLSVGEKIALLDALVEAGIDPSRMMPGTGCCALTDTVRLTTHAVARGVAGVLMLPPFYYKGVSDEGLYRSFAEVIERVGDARLRIYLYHIPPIAQVPITLSLIERLRVAYPQVVVGIKDSSGDPANLDALLERFPDLAVFPGSETLLMRGRRQGAAGCISATANINPAAIVALADRWREADAEDRLERLRAVRKCIEAHPMIAALKATIAHFGDDPEWRRLRPPLVELSDRREASLIAELRRLAFDMPGLTPQL